MELVAPHIMIIMKSINFDSFVWNLFIYLLQIDCCLFRRIYCAMIVKLHKNKMGFLFK